MPALSPRSPFIEQARLGTVIKDYRRDGKQGKNAEEEFLRARNT